MAATTAPEVIDLVERHTDLALAIAARWGRAYPWLADDFRSDAALALFLACNSARVRADPGLAVRAIRTAVRWALVARLRTERAKSPGSFRQPTGDDTAPAPVVIDHRERSPGAGLDDADQVGHLLATLPERRRLVLTRAVVEGESLTAIAADMGVSRARVGQLVRAAVERLRKFGTG